MKALAIVGAILAALVAIAWYVAANPEQFSSTGGKQYGSSLADAVPIAAGAGGCGRAPDEEWWFCGIEKDVGSGYGAYYVLRTEDEACWTARRASLRRVRHDPPQEDVIAITERGKGILGCVGIGDYVFPNNPYGFRAERAGPPKPFVLRSESQGGAQPR